MQHDVIEHCEQMVHHYGSHVELVTLRYLQSVNGIQMKNSCIRL